MASKASAALTALAAALATVAGLAAARVVRGSPPLSAGRPQPSTPCIYLWIQSATSTRGPVSRLWTVELTVGIYVHSAAAAGTVASIEGAALELAHEEHVAICADPTVAGTVHDVVRYDVTENGALPGSDGSAPACWMAGSVTLRYDTLGQTGGL